MSFAHVPEIALGVFIGIIAAYFALRRAILCARERNRERHQWSTETAQTSRAVLRVTVQARASASASTAAPSSAGRPIGSLDREALSVLSDSAVSSDRSLPGLWGRRLPRSRPQGPRQSLQSLRSGALGGADLRGINALLGHAKLATTVGYARLAAERLRSVFVATHPDNR